MNESIFNEQFKTTKIDLRKDTGYTKLCSSCNERYGAIASLRGKERWVDIKVCMSCEELYKNRQNSKYNEVKGMRDAYVQK